MRVQNQLVDDHEVLELFRERKEKLPPRHLIGDRQRLVRPIKNMTRRVRQGETDVEHLIL
jgi:hypothetical protein